jgi:hypothetical protein
MNKADKYKLKENEAVHQFNSFHGEGISLVPKKLLT